MHSWVKKEHCGWRPSRKTVPGRIDPADPCVDKNPPIMPVFPGMPAALILAWFGRKQTQSVESMTDLSLEVCPILKLANLGDDCKERFVKFPHYYSPTSSRAAKTLYHKYPYRAGACFGLWHWPDVPWITRKVAIFFPATSPLQGLTLHPVSLPLHGWCSGTESRNLYRARWASGATCTLESRCITW
jgi:hypothetical protein